MKSYEIPPYIYIYISLSLCLSGVFDPQPNIFLASIGAELS